MTEARRRPQRADYILRYARDFMFAIIEAKAAYRFLGDGLQQAKDYAELLGLKFASPPIATVSSSFDLRQRQGTGAGTLPTTDELRKGEDNIWHLESESRAHCVHGDADTAVADQRRIVAELDGLLSRVDALKTQVETSTELVALLPSILAEALRVNLSRRGAW